MRSGPPTARTSDVPLDHSGGDAARSGPSFSFRNRAERAAFMLTWTLLAGWTPPPLHRWRCLLLRWMGARIGVGVRLYGSVKVWHPANLSIGDGATIGPRVRLYNQGTITIGPRAIVSQGAHVCASSHDLSNRHMQLVLRPVTIGADAWIAADAFVGPGVAVGEGAVLGARGVAMRDLEEWVIYSGNPATALKRRLPGAPARG